MTTPSTDICMLIIAGLASFILVFLFVLSKKKTYDGKVSVYIDEDHDYKASITFDDLMNAANKGEGVFQIETIYIGSGD